MAREMRTFDAGGPAEGVEPIPFEVVGVRRSNGEQWSEAFTAVAEAPGGVIFDVGSAERVNGEGKTYLALGPLRDFFGQVLVETDRARFDAMIHDVDRVVRIDTLGEIFAWLVEGYAEVPTGPLST